MQIAFISIRSSRVAAVQVVLLSALLILALLVYLPGLSGPFLFDDYANIVNNQWLQLRANTPVDWRSAAFSSQASALHRPVTMLSVAFQTPQDGELTAAVLKMGNLLVHLFSGAALFLFARLLTQTPRWRLGDHERLFMPLLAAAIWLLSPLLVSTVLYPVQRMAQLSTLFVLIGLCIYLHYRIQWVKVLPSVDSLLACTLWLGLALVAGIYSKENAVVLPWLIVIIEFAFFRGYVAGRDVAGYRIASGVLFLAPLVCFAAFVVLGYDWINAGYVARPFDLEQRVLTQARLLWSYIGWFLLPQTSSLGMFHDDIPASLSLWAPWTTALAVFAWFLALSVALLLGRRLPLLLFAPFFYLAAHSLESSVLALELVFEHRNYLPSVAIAVTAAATLMRLARLAEQRGVSRVLAALPACALLLSLTASTAVRVANWASEPVLARAEVENHPDSARSAALYTTAMINAAKTSATQAERRERLALARHELEVLEQKHPGNLAALVMLYMTDVQLFPQLGGADERLAAIESSIKKNATPSATDFAALNVLVDCQIVNGCEIPDVRLQQILALFESRFSRPHAINKLRLSLLKSADTSGGRYLHELELTAREYDKDIELAYMLVEAYLKRGDYGSAHGAAIDLMRRDGESLQFPVIRDVFAMDKSTQ
ncbi:MAG: hypothetical protein AB8B57_05415 [Congregibacter sp.]